MPKTKRDKAKALIANAMAYTFYAQQMTEQLKAICLEGHPELANAIESVADGQLFTFRLLYSVAKLAWGEAADNWPNWSTVRQGREAIPTKGLNNASGGKMDA